MQQLESERKVLMLAPVPFYEDRGTPIALKLVLTALHELGYRIDLVTYPIGQSTELPGVRHFRTANPFGFRTVKIGLSWKKLILDVPMILALIRRLRRENYYCVHAVGEMVFPAAAVCRVFNLPLLYDMPSCLSEQMSSAPILGLEPMQRLLRYIESRMLSRCAFIIASAGLAGTAQALAPDVANAEWLFPVEANPTPERSREDVRSELGVPRDANLVLYTGNFESYQGIPILLKAIPKTLQNGAKYVFRLRRSRDARRSNTHHGRARCLLSAERPDFVSTTAQQNARFAQRR